MIYLNLTRFLDFWAFLAACRGCLLPFWASRCKTIPSTLIPKIKFCLVQAIPWFSLFWIFLACSRFTRGFRCRRDPIFVFRICMSIANVYLLISSYFWFKLTHFHWIYHVIPQFQWLFSSLGLLRAPFCPGSLRPVNLMLFDY